MTSTTTPAHPISPQRLLRALVLALAMCLACAIPAAAQEPAAPEAETMDTAPTAVPAATGAPSPCPDTEVTVVVEGAGTGCASAGTTGVEALEEAGFAVEFVSGQQGFICTIAGMPEDISCATTPGADAYWAYYQASPGDTEWAYATAGPTEYRPAAGAVEGWAYGSGVAPAEIPAPATEDSVAAAQADDDRQADSQDDSSSTATIGLIAGIVVIVVLLGVGIAMMRRRRGADQ